MTSLVAEAHELYSNPLDQIESLLLDKNWTFDRPSDDELVIDHSGLWCHYRLWFTWQPEMQAVIFVCAFDTKIAPRTRAKLYPLLSLINEKLWIGHFELSSLDGDLCFRHSLLLRGTGSAASDQAEDLLDIALGECERFYPAFQSVIWGGKKPEEALEAAIFDTVGEA